MVSILIYSMILVKITKLKEARSCGICESSWFLPKNDWNLQTHVFVSDYSGTFAWNWEISDISRFFPFCSEPWLKLKTGFTVENKKTTQLRMNNNLLFGGCRKSLKTNFWKFISIDFSSIIHVSGFHIQCKSTGTLANKHTRTYIYNTLWAIVHLKGIINERFV